MFDLRASDSLELWYLCDVWDKDGLDMTAWTLIAAIWAALMGTFVAACIVLDWIEDRRR